MKFRNPFVKKQENINTQYSNETGRLPLNATRMDRTRRGIQVYSPSQLMALTGRDQDGRLLSWHGEQPYFYLTNEQRNQIFKLSSPIFGVVSSRMNRISSIDFNIVPVRKIEDQISDQLKDKATIYNELKGSIDIRDLMLKAKIFKELKQDLPLLKNDLSNFNSCLLRWRKSLQKKIENSSDEIKDWLMEPNQGTTWESYIKKVVFDLHIHGCSSTYKEVQDGRVENFDTLIGGSVFKMKEAYFSSINGYIQVIYGFEPQMFFDNEIMYMEWLPTSVQSQSMVPLEALINMIAEQLLFDGRMAEQADGTAPPEKLVVITESSPFGDLTDNTLVPLNPHEQKRIETKINEPRKNKIMTFSGNHVEVVDLSMDNKLEFFNLRRKDIREEVGLVFNMSNMEMNLTGSDDTSGRQTADAQLEIEQGKGTGPILKLIQSNISRYILPHRYGSGWQLEFIRQKNELEERQLDLLKLQTGEYTQNELREYRGQPQFDDERFNLPKDSAPQEAGENQLNPLYMKQLQ